MERNSMISEKAFKKQIRVSTILHQIGGYGWRRHKDIQAVPDDNLIKEWWYSRLANVYVRYWSLCPHTTTNEQITLDQVGGDDYRIALQRLLEERGIFEKADNSYSIDFAAIRADAEQKRRPIAVRGVAFEYEKIH
jgi:hypothetical protein